LDSNSLFNKFYDKLFLTDSQKEDAIKKYNGVCETLHNKFYNTKYNGSTKFLIGSYGKSTNIRPPRDIDVIFKMPNDLFPKYNAYKGNGQSQLLQDIRNILKDTYSTTEKIRGWGKVVLVKFADNTHDVEVLPAWETDDNKYKIPNTENNGNWEIVDPRSEMEEIINCNKRYCDKCTFFIRIFKRWTEFCSVNIKSFIIEQKTVQYLKHYNSIMPNVSDEILRFFIFLSSFFYDDEKSKIESAKKRAEKALNYDKSGDLQSASVEWRKIFGKEFPMYKVAKLNEEFQSYNEQYIDGTIGFPIEINPTYEFKIDAEITQDGFRPQWLSYYLDKIWFLKKKIKIIFKVKNINIPKPYELFWKVRNYGQEASSHNDLRGEITKDNGNMEKIENTKYKGEHYVECYCIKDGKCVALDQIFVPIE